MRGLRDPAVRVSLPSGRYFYPIFLTDKRQNEWVCNHIKVRIACLGKIESVSEGTRITLTTSPKLPYGIAVSILVNANGRIQYQNNGRHFVLVPQMQKLRGQVRDVSEYVVEKADSTPCGGYNPCSAKRIAMAEKTMLEVIRNDRLRSIKLSRDERESDVREFLDKYSKLVGDAYLVHRVIALNEIGASPDGKANYSPFEVLDAIYDKSGPSFGAQQIDVGSNKSTDRVPFRRVVFRVLSSSRDLGLRRLASAARSGLDKMDGPLKKPIREYNIRTFADFYRAAPLLTDGLRSDIGRRDYYPTYERFLKQSAGRMAALHTRGGVFAQSAFARVYVIDIANQFGEGVAVRAARAALEAKDIEDGSKRMKEFVREKTKYGRLHRDDVDRRIKNIERLVMNLNQEGGGNPTECDLAKLRRL